MRLLSLIAPTMLGIIPLMAKANVLSQWRDLKFSMNMSPFHVMGEGVQAVRANMIPFDFFERAASLGHKVQEYVENQLHQASEIYEGAAPKIEELKATISELVSSAHEIKQFLYWQDLERDDDIVQLQEDFSRRFSREMAGILEVMQKEFPNPKEAPHHEDRERMVLSVLDQIEDRFLHLVGQYGHSEERAREYFERIKPTILKMTVITGDLAEQHPTILEIILFSSAVMIIPESWILRPILSLFGFGPYGPVKGSAAAWAQRRFWGAAVAEGSWFARLQAAGMKIPTIPWKAIVGVGSGVAVGLRGCF